MRGCFLKEEYFNNVFQLVSEDDDGTKGPVGMWRWRLHVYPWHSQTRPSDPGQCGQHRVDQLIAQHSTFSSRMAPSAV